MSEGLSNFKKRFFILERNCRDDVISKNSRSFRNITTQAAYNATKKLCVAAHLVEQIRRYFEGI